MKHLHLSALAGLSLTGAACATKTGRPTPTVSGLDPAAACQTGIVSLVRVLDRAGQAPDGFLSDSIKTAA
jgi:hypothetical protein